MLGAILQAVGGLHEAFVDSHHDANRENQNAKSRRKAPADGRNHAGLHGAVQFAHGNGQDVGPATLAGLPVFHLESKDVLAVASDAVGGVAVTRHAALAHDDWAGIGDHTGFVIEDEYLVLSIVLNLLEKLAVEIGIGHIGFIARIITDDVELDRSAFNRPANSVPCGNDRNGFVEGCILVIFLALFFDLLGEFCVVECSGLGHLTDRVRRGFGLNENRAHFQLQAMADCFDRALIDHIEAGRQSE